MRFGYADPPYFGCGKSRYGFPEWDTVERHAALIAQLVAEFPDGWALSMHTPSIRVLSPLLPANIRWGSWNKPFASFKPGVNPAYTWEPVAFIGGRKRPRTELTARDSHTENITLKKGLCGAKPPKFGGFIEGLLGARSADTIVDLFPGTNGLHGLAEWERGNPAAAPPTQEGQ